MSLATENIDLKKRALQGLFFFSLLLPLTSDSFSFDRYYSIGWVLLSVFTLVFFFLQTYFNWKGFLVGLSILTLSSLMASSFGYYIDLAVLAHMLVVLLLFCIPFSREQSSLRKLLFLPIMLAFIVMSGILVYLLIQNYITHGYSHKITYQVTPFFAHRNIALEHTSILALLLLFLSPKWQHVAKWLPLFLVLVIFYQARAALLILGIGMLVWVFQFTSIRKPILIATGLIVCYFLTTALWSYVFFESYQLWVERLPDVVKSIDPVYNVFYMPSSSERMKIWTWTWNELSLIPHGLGQWKILAQGWIILPNYDCLTIVRRPHNELLLFLYELGWIGGVLFLALLVYLKPSRNWLITLPLLLFSFPLERASMIIPLLLLLSIGYAKPVSTIVKWQRWAVISLLVGTIAIHTSRWRADYLFASFTKEVSAIRSLGSLDEQVLSIFPYDFMLNHTDKYKAFTAIDEQEIGLALDLVWQNYHRNPNFYGNYIFLKQLVKDVKGQEVQSNIKYSCEIKE